MVKKTKVAVIGGGVSGLTIAYLLKQKDIEVCVFERSHRAGGVIGTKIESGYLIEHGASSLLNTEPKTFELIKLLNLDNQVVKAKADASHRYIYINKTLHKVPFSPPEFLKTKLLSFSTKMKIWLESRFPPKIVDSPDTRTLFDFAKDHFGEELAENVVRPMMVGVFGGDAAKLSLNRSLPRMVEMEKQYKSLIVAMKSAKQKPASISFKNGLQTLVDALVKQLGEFIYFNSYVTKIERIKKGFMVHYQDEVESQTYTDEFQEVIICLPPLAMSGVLEGLLDEVTLEKLAEFPTAPIKTFTIAFAEPLKFKGFGTLVSPKDDLKILGFLHPKDIFEGRCPENKDLVTVMMGGVFQPQAVNWSVQNSLKTALEALEKILGPLPAVEKYWMWNHSPGIPQNEITALEFLKHFEDQVTATKGVSLNSTISGGVAVNDCIRKSFELADKFDPQNFKIVWVPDQSPEDEEVF